MSPCRPQGKLPDYNEPVIVPAKRCTVEDFCNRLHKTMVKQLK
jgi:ribosome-interacting GTPase 1